MSFVRWVLSYVASQKKEDAGGRVTTIVSSKNPCYGPIVAYLNFGQIVVSEENRKDVMRQCHRWLWAMEAAHVASAGWGPTLSSKIVSILLHGRYNHDPLQLGLYLFQEKKKRSLWSLPNVNMAIAYNSSFICYWNLSLASRQ